MADDWHLIGTREELLERVPFATRVGGSRVAIFHYDGAFRAIADACNHKGGPLSEGRGNGEYVMCPWHGWEYSVVTGQGPEGFDEEQVAVFAVDERADGVYVSATPAVPRRLLKHKPSHLLDEHPKDPDAPVRVLGIATTAMDAGNPRFSTSDHLLEHALAYVAAERGAEIQLIRLRDLDFLPCEGNYSKHARACTWPCAITERLGDRDGLTPVYEALVHWADVVLVSTPIRWGAQAALYFKMAERLNCIQNQITTSNRVLINNKVAAFIITGGQDNVQGVAGSMLTFWSELGYVFPPFPFIAHTRGWDAEDMQNNVRLVRRSTDLADAASELVERAVDFWAILDLHRRSTQMHVPRAGRKASGLPLVTGD
jgi:nitrite reductase/ring-hydroxylating ferredoxin subunit/multimeric flavodoxin WrbA